ncbi:hypothetical protein Droror1_Dr00004104 [Drosera rotundifolia]
MSPYNRNSENFPPLAIPSPISLTWLLCSTHKPQFPSPSAVFPSPIVNAHKLFDEMLQPGIAIRPAVISIQTIAIQMLLLLCLYTQVIFCVVGLPYASEAFQYARNRLSEL